MKTCDSRRMISWDRTPPTGLTKSPPLMKMRTISYRTCSVWISPRPTPLDFFRTLQSRFSANSKTASKTLSVSSHPYQCLLATIQEEERKREELEQRNKQLRSKLYEPDAKQYSQSVVETPSPPPQPSHQILTELTLENRRLKEEVAKLHYSKFRVE